MEGTRVMASTTRCITNAAELKAAINDLCWEVGEGLLSTIGVSIFDGRHDNPVFLVWNPAQKHLYIIDRIDG